MTAKPALKPSKYGPAGAGGGAGGKRASFQMPDADNSVDDSDASPPPRPSRLPMNRRRSHDSGGGPTFQPDNINGGFRPAGLAASKNDDNASFRPAAMQVGPRRRPTAGSEGSGGLRGSFTGPVSNRPGIQRRNSMSSAKKSASFASDVSDVEKGIMQRQKSSGAGSVFSSVSQREATARRLSMAVEDQTFVPPKSRASGLFSAVTHAMAGRLSDLILWTYDASAFKVIAFFLVAYISNIFLWAIVLDSIDLATGSYCIHEDPEMAKHRATRFEYVFELSWATFTTVGYGTISPQGDETGCYAVRFACAMVAFIGVLYASVSKLFVVLPAIFRVQSTARASTLLIFVQIRSKCLTRPFMLRRRPFWYHLSTIAQTFRTGHPRQRLRSFTPSSCVSLPRRR